MKTMPPLSGKGVQQGSCCVPFPLYHVPLPEQGLHARHLPRHLAILHLQGSHLAEDVGALLLSPTVHSKRDRDQAAGEGKEGRGGEGQGRGRGGRGEREGREGEGGDLRGALKGKGPPAERPLRGASSRGYSTTTGCPHLVPLPEQRFHGRHLASHLAVLNLQGSHLALDGRWALPLLQLPVAVPQCLSQCHSTLGCTSQ